jgi:hypothetical protein
MLPMLHPRSRGTIGRGWVAAIVFCTSSLRSHSLSVRGVRSGCENSGLLCGPCQRSQPGSTSANGSLADVMVVDVIARGIIGTDRQDYTSAQSLALR